MEIYVFIGILQLYPYTFTPLGYMSCEGQTLSISQYQTLYALIGSTYGGDGRTTFALPNLKGAEPLPQMKYYIAKTVSGEFSAIVERVIESLKAEGFGVLTDIDVKATMKKKLDIDFRDYRILGACNPPLAHQALTADDKIGTMLPCNVIVQDLGGGKIEVAAINPAVSMEHVGNPTLNTLAETVTSKLKRVIATI